jgi:amino-acid N-acetyltransferase
MAMRVVVSNGPGRKRSAASGRSLKAAEPRIALRFATPADAPALFELIATHLEEGRLLPRTLDDLVVHAPRFVVAVEALADDDRIVGCAELAPLSPEVAEIRSLVVGRSVRRLGLGIKMVEALNARARAEGFTRLCAFAHDPAFFVRRGFSIVPHTWVPEKIAHDCTTCPLFRNCGQFAIVRDIAHENVHANVRTNVRTTV